MSSKLERTLYRAAALTFEELAFMMVLPETEEPQPWPAADAAASVEFGGPFGGRLVVRVTEELLPTIAANMLGEDEVPSAQQQHDALGEIANVICGNVLPGIAGSSAVFHIGAPCTGETAHVSAEGAGSSPAAQVHVAFEQGEAHLSLFISEVTPSGMAQP